MTTFALKTPHDVSPYLPTNVIAGPDQPDDIVELEADFTVITADAITPHETLEAACQTVLAYLTHLASPSTVVGELSQPWTIRAEIRYAILIGVLRYCPLKDVRILQETLNKQRVQPLYHLNSLKESASFEEWVVARLLTHQFILPFSADNPIEWRDDDTAYRNPDVVRKPDTNEVFARVHPLVLGPYGFLWSQSQETLFVSLKDDNITVPTIYRCDDELTEDREQANHYAYRTRCTYYERWLHNQSSPYAILDKDSLGSLFKRHHGVEEDPYLLALYAMVYQYAYEEGLSRKQLIQILREDYPRYAEQFFTHSTLRLMVHSYSIDSTPLNHTLPIRQVEWVAVGSCAAIVNTENGWKDFLQHVAGQSKKKIPPIPLGMVYPSIVSVKHAPGDTLLVDTIPLTNVTTALRTVGLQ